MNMVLSCICEFMNKATVCKTDEHLTKVNILYSVLVVEVCLLK